MIDSFEGNLTKEGRLLIPASLRRAAGLSAGSKVRLRLQGDEIVVANPALARRRLRGSLAGVSVNLADELIGERHAEAAAEKGAAHLRRSQVRGLGRGNDRGA